MELGGQEDREKVSKFRCGIQAGWYEALVTPMW
jgi:hypothetical protein